MIALGSATHTQSSCTRMSMVSVRGSNTKRWHVLDKAVTYPQRAVPMNDIPEIFEEPLLRSSTLFGFEIPLVSLRIFAFSSIGLCEEVKKPGCPQHHTENPGRVCRSWDIPDRRKPPAPSKKGIYEDDRSSRECSELILHGQFVRSKVRRAEVLIYWATIMVHSRRVVVSVNT